MTVPLLTPQQRHRLAVFFFENQLFPSMQSAKKATKTDYRCKDVFLKNKHFIDNVCFLGIPAIQDIYDLYAVKDVKETHNKVKQSNCGADLLTDKSNRTHNKKSLLVAKNNSIVNQTHKKVRGKQKAPTMEHHRVRLPVDMLDSLKSLDGTVSQHIRQAIDQYLNSLVV